MFSWFIQFERLTVTEEYLISVTYVLTSHYLDGVPSPVHREGGVVMVRIGIGIRSNTPLTGTINIAILLAFHSIGRCILTIPGCLRGIIDKFSIIVNDCVALLEYDLIVLGLGVHCEEAIATDRKGALLDAEMTDKQQMDVAIGTPNTGVPLALRTIGLVDTASFTLDPTLELRLTIHSKAKLIS
jgi:hypothetical protein